MKNSEKLIIGVNAALVLAYAVTAMFINGSGQITGLSNALSCAIIYTLLAAGITVALVSLTFRPRKWPVPLLCLLIYLSFLV